MTIASWRDLTTPLVELAGTLMGSVSAILVAILFMKEWREAILQAPQTP